MAGRDVRPPLCGINHGPLLLPAKRCSVQVNATMPSTVLVPIADRSRAALALPRYDWDLRPALFVHDNTGAWNFLATASYDFWTLCT